MTPKLQNAVYRSYIALARDEKVMPCELGDTLDFVAPYSGRVIDRFQLTQTDWRGNERLRDSLCKAKNISIRDFFEMMIIPKPSALENFVYSLKLRHVYGSEILCSVNGFNGDGVLILPRERGCLAAVKENGFIIGLNQYKTD